jgi:hypothetical protein
MYSTKCQPLASASAGIFASYVVFVFCSQREVREVIAAER